MRPPGSHGRPAGVQSPPSLSVPTSSLKHERKGSSRTSKHVVEDPSSSSPALNLNLEDESLGSQVDGSSSAVQPLVELDKLLAVIERIEKLTLEDASAIDDLKGKGIGIGIGIGIGLQDNQASGEGSSGIIKHVVEDPLSSAALLTLEDASAIDDLKRWFLKFNRRLAEFMKVQKTVALIMRRMEQNMSKQAPSGPQYDIRNRLLLKMNLVLARWKAALWARLEVVKEMEIERIENLKKRLGLGLQDNQVSGEGSRGSIKHVVEDPLLSAALLTLEDASAINDLEGWFNRRFVKLTQVQKTVALVMRKTEQDMYASKQALSGRQYDSWNRLLLKINLLLAKWTAALWARLQAVEEMEKRLAFKLAPSPLWARLDQDVRLSRMEGKVDRVLSILENTVFPPLFGIQRENPGQH